MTQTGTKGTEPAWFTFSCVVVREKAANHLLSAFVGKSRPALIKFISNLPLTHEGGV